MSSTKKKERKIQTGDAKKNKKSKQKKNAHPFCNLNDRLCSLARCIKISLNLFFCLFALHIPQKPKPIVEKILDHDTFVEAGK